MILISQVKGDLGPHQFIQQLLHCILNWDQSTRRWDWDHHLVFLHLKLLPVTYHYLPITLVTVSVPLAMLWQTALELYQDSRCPGW